MNAEAVEFEADLTVERAAGEHVALELRPGHQLLGGGAERLETLEPEGERGRHVLGARAAGLDGVGQQQPRFEVGEPGGHYQVVRRQLHAQLARLLDENEVLICQRQDRNLGQIDFLLAGKH